MGEVKVKAGELRDSDRRLAVVVRDYAVLWGVSVSAITALRGSPTIDFSRYFADVDPTIAAGAVGLAGLATLRALSTEGWLSFGGVAALRRGAVPAITAASGFGAFIVAADWFMGFPNDINVAWPQSLLFYPAMGFVAEVVFHLVPVALAATALRHVRRHVTGRWATIGVIALVALLEAGFQVFIGLGESDPLLSAYLAVHLIAFSAVQLAIMRTHGLGSLMLMRLVYYLIWHIVWGSIRLDTLL